MSPNAALALVDDSAAADRTLPIQSDLLGPLDVPLRSIFTFPTGIFGFPECRRFALVATGREGMFWLQSLDHTALAFLLADPFQHVADYGVELGAGDRLDLAVRDAGDVAILCIVTLPRTRAERPTMNLQGPVALNFAACLGRQLALGDTTWGTRCPLDLGAGD